MSKDYSYMREGSVWLNVPRSQIERAIQHQVPFFKTLIKITEGECEQDLDKLASDVLPEMTDLTWSLCFSPPFLARLFYAGFLPIAQEIGQTDPASAIYVLLPKMHIERCVLLDLTLFRVNKKTQKDAKYFSITLNSCFSRVLDRCLVQHGAQCWLLPPLRNALSHIYKSKGKFPVSVVSVEVWRDEELVAGEVGVLVGAVYTSLTGFSDRLHNSGKVQLAALCRVLQTSGVRIWDLGMSLPYKLELGATVIPRSEFLRNFRLHRDLATELRLDGEAACGPLVEKSRL